MAHPFQSRGRLNVVPRQPYYTPGTLDDPFPMVPIFGVIALAHRGHGKLPL
jgi:hypothetical protein